MLSRNKWHRVLENAKKSQHIEKGRAWGEKVGKDTHMPFVGIVGEGIGVAVTFVSAYLKGELSEDQSFQKATAVGVTDADIE